MVLGPESQISQIKLKTIPEIALGNLVSCRVYPLSKASIAEGLLHFSEGEKLTPPILNPEPLYVPYWAVIEQTSTINPDP